MTQMFNRPSIDDYFIAMSVLTSTRGSCSRRRTGCVLVDNNNHVLSTGYNGPARGSTNCIENPCGGISFGSGKGLDRCEAIHAEANAIIQCKSPQQVVTAYCTDSPCVFCVGLLMNTSCRRIVFLREYAHDSESQRRWFGRKDKEYEWIQRVVTNHKLDNMIEILL